MNSRIYMRGILGFFCQCFMQCVGGCDDIEFSGMSEPED